MVGDITFMMEYIMLCCHYDNYILTGIIVFI